MSSLNIDSNVITPSFVKKEGSSYICSCTACKDAPTTHPNLAAVLIHLNRTIDLAYYECPVKSADGKPCPYHIPMMAGIVTAHVKTFHPNLAKKFKLNKGSTIIFCEDCNDYADELHYHCQNCECYYTTREERNQHLKDEHAKWFTENLCRFNTDCHGYKSGACAFNHGTTVKSISDNNSVPEGFCRYDKPWDHVRCKREQCRFNHFWGRVRFILGLKASKKSETKKSDTDILRPEAIPTNAPAVCESGSD